MSRVMSDVCRLPYSRTASKPFHAEYLKSLNSGSNSYKSNQSVDMNKTCHGIVNHQRHTLICNVLGSARLSK